MRKRCNTLPVIAFSTSLVVHAMLLIVLPMAIAAATPKAQRNDEKTPESQTMTLPVEVQLGIDEPAPELDTWLGHAEAELQRAEKAEVEQAAFTSEPMAAAPQSTPATSEVPNPVLPQPQAPSEPQEAPVPTELAHAPAELEQRQVDPPPPSMEELIGELPLGETSQPNLDPQSPAVNLEQAEIAADTIEAVKDLLRELQRAMEQRPSEPAKHAAAEQPAPPPAQPTPESQAAPASVQALSDVGTPSDKQSSPTSLVEIPPEQWQLGKPLAREGLTLKPRRPEFTLLVMLTSSPGNPHVMISFGRDGVPTVASLVRSSGDRRVDDAILASLYRWRAEGKELEKLAPGKTLDVRMRIVLNRRAKD